VACLGCIHAAPRADEKNLNSRLDPDRRPLFACSQLRMARPTSKRIKRTRLGPRFTAPGRQADVRMGMPLILIRSKD
jgi:hypothetical protein